MAPLPGSIRIGHLTYTVTEDDAAAREESALPNLVVTEYVVITAYAGWDDEGEPVSAVSIIPAGERHRMLGLLAEAEARFTADTLADYHG